MFGGDDGFPFGMMNNMHRQMMAEMDAMMGDPFGGLFGRRVSPFAALTGVETAQQQQPQLRSARTHQLALDPFGGFGFGGIFNAMNEMSERAMHDPESVMFSQQTTFTWGPDGKPKVVENSVRKSGDCKETRRRVQDGEEELMSIGHHIGDRTHVIEKKRDKDGIVRKQQKFVNLDEEHAEDFDREFHQRARDNLGRRGHASAERSNYYLENGGENGSRRSSRHNSGSSSTYGNRHTGGETSSSSRGGGAPIVTLPEEEEVDEGYRRSSSSRHIGGPVIREISEEEAEQSIPKRRRGLFGSFRAE